MMNKESKDNGKRMLTKGMCGLLAAGLVFGGAGFSGRLQAFADEKDDKVALQRVSEEEEGTQNKGYLDVSDIVSEVMPSVVTITTKSIEEVQDYFGMFGFYGYAPSYSYEVTGSGSGIIIGKNDDELLIATNAHIVEGTSVLSVCFADNEAYKGIVKGYDVVKDVAVVAVNREDLKKDTLNAISVAKIGSSDALKVGEQVIAIGNAMGYGQSVTTGIVSAKNRQMNDDVIRGYKNASMSEDDGVNLIQTDAAINPGNSGGALLNMDGEVVGITNSKLVSNEVESMCYAIAISDVEELINDLMNQKTRERVEGTHGALGIRATSVSTEAHQVYRMPLGAFIAEVEEGSAAEEAGLHAGMIITKLDGRGINSVDALVDLLAYYEPGEEAVVTVSVQEGNNYTSKEFTVKLQKSVSENDSEEKDSKEKSGKPSRKSKQNDSDEEEDQQEEDQQEDRSHGFFDDWFDFDDDDFYGDDYYDDDYFGEEYDDFDGDDDVDEDDDDDLEKDDTDYSFGKGSFGKWE